MTSKVSKEMRDLLSRLADQNEARRAAGMRTAVPEVGIFFAFDGHLWVDGTPVSEAVLYGDLKIHDKGHDTFWEELQKAHAVPSVVEYYEVPRGRVAYDTKMLSFLVLADRCIRKDEHMVGKIFDVMHLPSSPAHTTVGPDSHYMCPACMPHSEE